MNDVWEVSYLIQAQTREEAHEWFDRVGTLLCDHHGTDHDECRVLFGVVKPVEVPDGD